MSTTMNTEQIQKKLIYLRKELAKKKKKFENFKKRSSAKAHVRQKIQEINQQDSQSPSLNKNDKGESGKLARSSSLEDFTDQSARKSGKKSTVTFSFELTPTSESTKNVPSKDNDKKEDLHFGVQSDNDTLQPELLKQDLQVNLTPKNNVGNQSIDSTGRRLSQKAYKQKLFKKNKKSHPTESESQETDDPIPDENKYMGQHLVVTDDDRHLETSNDCVKESSGRNVVFTQNKQSIISLDCEELKGNQTKEVVETSQEYEDQYIVPGTQVPNSASMKKIKSLFKSRRSLDNIIGKTNECKEKSQYTIGKNIHENTILVQGKTSIFEQENKDKHNVDEKTIIEDSELTILSLDVAMIEDPETSKVVVDRHDSVDGESDQEDSCNMFLGKTRADIQNDPYSKSCSISTKDYLKNEIICAMTDQQEPAKVGEKGKSQEKDALLVKEEFSVLFKDSEPNDLPNMTKCTKSTDVMQDSEEIIPSTIQPSKSTARNPKKRKRRCTSNSSVLDWTFLDEESGSDMYSQIKTRRSRRSQSSCYSPNIYGGAPKRNSNLPSLNSSLPCLVSQDLEPKSCDSSALQCLPKCLGGISQNVEVGITNTQSESDQTISDIPPETNINSLDSSMRTNASSVPNHQGAEQDQNSCSSINTMSIELNSATQKEIHSNDINPPSEKQWPKLHHLSGCKFDRIQIPLVEFSLPAGTFGHLMEMKMNEHQKENLKLPKLMPDLVDYFTLPDDDFGKLKLEKIVNSQSDIVNRLTVSSLSTESEISQSTSSSKNKEINTKRRKKQRKLSRKNKKKSQETESENQSVNLAEGEVFAEVNEPKTYDSSQELDPLLNNKSEECSSEGAIHNAAERELGYAADGEQSSNPSIKMNQEELSVLPERVSTLNCKLKLEDSIQMGERMLGMEMGSYQLGGLELDVVVGCTFSSLLIYASSTATDGNWKTLLNLPHSQGEVKEAGVILLPSEHVIVALVTTLSQDIAEVKLVAYASDQEHWIVSLCGDDRCHLPICCYLSESAICMALPSADEPLTLMQSVTLTPDLHEVLTEVEWESVDQTLCSLTCIQGQEEAVLGCSKEPIIIWDQISGLQLSIIPTSLPIQACLAAIEEQGIIYLWNLFKADSTGGLTAINPSTQKCVPIHYFELPPALKNTSLSRGCRSGENVVVIAGNGKLFMWAMYSGRLLAGLETSPLAVIGVSSSSHQADQPRIIVSHQTKLDVYSIHQ